MVNKSPSLAVRVAQLVITLEPGGMENGVVNLANGLREHGVETKVVCLGGSGRLAKRLHPDCEITALEKRGGFRVEVVKQVSRVVSEWGADIVHTHNLGPLIYGVCAKRLCVGSAWQIVHGEHGQLTWEGAYRKRWEMQWRLLQRRLLFRHCAAVHTVSREMVRDLESFGLRHQRMIGIPNGVDCDRFHPSESKSAAKVRIGLPPESVVIGNVGRMFPHKRQILLVEAFDSLAKKYANVRLLFVGDSQTGRDSLIQRVQESPFCDRITITGFQPDPVPFYHAMDYLAVPSLYEGMSNVVLEAMACGIPVIAHDACGMAEMIAHEQSGLVGAICKPEDFQCLLEQLLCDEVATKAYGLKARKRAESLFAMEVMLRNYTDLFRAVKGQNSSRASMG